MIQFTHDQLEVLATEIAASAEMVDARFKTQEQHEGFVFGLKAMMSQGDWAEVCCKAREIYKTKK